MARNYSNIALDTTLTAGVLAGDLTCVVASAAGWPAAPFAAVLDPGSLTIEEVVQVTLVVGTTFTITRGFDGTTAAAHSAGATVRHSAIAGDFTDLQAALLNVAYTNAANVFTLHNAFGANGAIDSGALLWPANTYSAVLALAEEMTTAGAVQKSGVLSFVKFNPVGANTGLVYGIDAEVETTAGNVQTHGNFFAGIFGSVRHKNAMAITNVRGLEFLAANSGGATVTNVQGALVTAMASASSVTTNLVGVDVSLLNFTSAVTTNAYGVRVQAPSNSATIVNNYGLNIANISGGTTINRAIHTAGGEVRHLTGAAAVIGLALQAFAAQSADMLQLLASDGTTKLAYFDSAGELFLPTKTANTVYAGPTSGGAAIPAFRALVAADLPTIAEGRLKIGGTTYYSIPGVNVTAVSAQAIAINTVLYMPVFVTTPITIDQLALEVTVVGAAAGTARMGIYAATIDWQPGALIVDAGTVLIDVLGVRTAAISQVLAPGRYLFALNCGVTFTARRFNGTQQYIGLDSALGASALIFRLSAVQAFGAFPGTGTAITTVSGGAAFGHLIVCRVSVP